MNEEILIIKAVLHILDANINMPVLSNKELEIDSDISEFLSKHIEKVMKDNNLKNGTFKDENNMVLNLCRLLTSDDSEFLNVSAKISEALFLLMQKHVDIPSADLICCLFKLENVSYLSLLKMNYKSGYTHFVQYEEEGNINTIIKHKTLLPSDGQKVDECVVINLETFKVGLIEKEYEINGEKDFYLSRLLLNCQSDLSNNAKLKILDKVTKKINKKYYDEDFEKVAQLKKAVTESFEETSTVKIDDIAEEVFERNTDIRKEYVEEIKKAGLKEEAIYVPEELIEKKFRTHKIKTDTGIEINFPLDCYNDKDKIEFVNNPDGTISIFIKNVTKISNK